MRPLVVLIDHVDVVSRGIETVGDSGKTRSSVSFIHTEEPCEHLTDVGTHEVSPRLTDTINQIVPRSQQLVTHDVPVSLEFLEFSTDRVGDKCPDTFQEPPDTLHGLIPLLTKTENILDVDFESLETKKGGTQRTSYDAFQTYFPYIEQCSTDSLNDSPRTFQHTE